MEKQKPIRRRRNVIVKGSTGTPKPLTHEERVKLINAPLPIVNVVGGRSWGGTVVGDTSYQRSIAHRREVHGDYLARFAQEDDWEREKI